MKEHEKRFGERIKATREAAISLDAAASRVGGAVHHAWGTMDSTTSEYGMRMVQSLREISQELSNTQASAAFADAEKFHRTSVEALNKIIKTIRRYVPKLHRGLKTEMAALNSALSKLENSVRALGIALDDSPGSRVEVVRREAQSLVERHSELTNLRREAEETVASLEGTIRKESELQDAENKLTAQDAFAELKRCEDALRAKEEEIKQFFQPVAKPLVKLERLPLPRGSPPIDSRTVHGVVDEPVQTISTGQSFAITQLFNRLDEALTQGKVEIEERRRRKAEETINEVKSGGVERMRDGYQAAQANVQEMLRQLRAKGLWEQKESLDQQIAETTHEKERTTSRRDDLHRRIEDVNRNLQRQKTSLEEQMTKLTKQPIKILSD
jgi:chromosome segregation ATPase